MHKSKKAIVLLTLLATLSSLNAEARTTTKDAFGGLMLFGTGIAVMMQTTCSEAAADMWDMDADICHWEHIQASLQNHISAALPPIFKLHIYENRISRRITVPIVERRTITVPRVD